MRKIDLPARKRIVVLFALAFAVFLWWWTDPTPKTSGTIKVYDRNDQLLYESTKDFGHQEFVKTADMPQDLKTAVVYTEDERFWKHLGVDPISIFRAFAQNVESGKIVSGASTIPQQLVRFTVISPHAPAKVSIMRKVRESLMAIRLSLTTSKEKVLEEYLNNMNFGRGAYGVQAASKVYFGKDMTNLSLAQSALLAAMIANPSRFDPISHSDEALQRRNWVLDKLLEKGVVDKEKYERAKEEELPRKTFDFEFVAPHAVQMAIDKADELGYSGGISIYTTLDSGWYELTRRIANLHVDKLRDEHDLTNAAVVIIENKTGNIVSLLGSVDYFNGEIQGKNNMALALRQPGSAMKPVTYAAAFADGIATPATAIEDVPKVYLTKKGEGFTPNNYDGRYRGTVLVREALASSYNLPAVEMLNRVGVERFLDLTHKMGVTSMNNVGNYDLALTLGGGEISLLELTNLYSTFARGGKFIPYKLVEKVVSDKGEVLYQAPKVDGKSVLDEKVAWLITNILSDPKARIPTFGEKSQLVLDKPAAVKTGTTTDWHDNWTVGYTPEYSVGVWVGNADNHPMRQISGVTGAAPIWNQVFGEILKFNESSNFIRPPGVVEDEICAWDGLLPGDDCNEHYLEYFIDGNQPIKYSPLSSKPVFNYSSNLQIISPKQGTVYEAGTVNNETVVFELSSYDGIENIKWIINGKEIPQNECGQFKLDCIWTPVPGDYHLQAHIRLNNNEEIDVDPVNFKVLEYKKDW